MEREELKNKIDEVLGGTQLTLSERTINEELDDVLEDVTDDEQVDDKFVTRIVNRLKRMDGNLHADVSTESKKYKKQFEEDWNKKHKTEKKEEVDDEPAYFKAYREKMEADMEALKNARKQDELKSYKENTMKNIKNGLKDLFKNADVEPNAYILNQTLRDVEIPEKDADVEAIVKKVEKSYYKNLKAAGLDEARPNGGNNYGGKNGKNAANTFFERKKAKEGWGKK